MFRHWSQAVLKRRKWVPQEVLSQWHQALQEAPAGVAESKPERGAPATPPKTRKRKPGAPPAAKATCRGGKTGTTQAPKRPAGGAAAPKAEMCQVVAVQAENGAGGSAARHAAMEAAREEAPARPKRPGKQLCPAAAGASPAAVAPDTTRARLNGPASGVAATGTLPNGTATCAAAGGAAATGTLPNGTATGAGATGTLPNGTATCAATGSGAAGVAPCMPSCTAPAAAASALAHQRPLNFWEKSHKQLFGGTMDDSEEESGEEAAAAVAPGTLVPVVQDAPPSPAAPPPAATVGSGEQALRPGPAAVTREAHAGYTFGYCSHSNKAWRKPVDQPRASPQFCECIYAPDGCSQTDPVIAVFGDGMEWAVSTLTALEHQAIVGGGKKRVCAPLRKPGAKSKTSAIVFEGKHSTRLEVVRVMLLKCEGLVSLRLKTEGTREKQVCQCTVTMVGGNTAEQAATDVMVQVAKKYLQDEVALTGLYVLRDALVQEFLGTKAAGAAATKGRKRQGAPQSSAAPPRSKSRTGAGATGMFPNGTAARKETQQEEEQSPGEHEQEQEEEEDEEERSVFSSEDAEEAAEALGLE